MNTKKLALFGAILLAAASTMADLRSETQKRLNRYCVAVKRRDASGIERELRDIFAPDFKFIPKKGKSMGLSRWIADEKMMVSMTQSVKSVSL
ncbi:MAG TPA: hypothetical protein VKT78_11015, partial [Fimbriimonadaceae bacterium]|nr:hypothetical protein [Fimbriimonadaceae bacterium]